jgi:peptidoglycan/LPS O-acetylase OafA/YrhL
MWRRWSLSVLPLSADQAARLPGVGIPAGPLRHVPALDGLRGLAVLSVLLFHGGVSWARGGFLGVDAFFVLSGFLITGLLLAEWDSRSAAGLRGAIDLVGFWGRRARRLLPALFVLVTTLLVAAVLYPPLRAQPGLRADIWSTFGYVANWHLVVAGGDYFTQTGPPSPLQHTWSLAIEEQFYLLWPLIVVAVLRLSGRRGLRSLSLIGAVISALLMAVLSTQSDGYDRVYYGTDTRAQSLLVGAALATLIPLQGRRPVGPPRIRARLVGIVAVCALAVLGATLTGTESPLYLGGFGFAAVAVAGIIYSALRDQGGPVARMTGLWPLRSLGVISYGVYLWHWPLFLALTAERTGQQGAALLWLRIAATVAVATLSYVLVEEPVRRHKALRGSRAFGFATAAATIPAVIVAAGLSGVTQPVVVRPLAAQRYAAPATAQKATSGPSSAARSHPGATRLLILGDSVAQTLFNGMPRYSQVAVVNKAMLGCGLLQQSPYRYLGQSKKVSKQCGDWPGNWSAAVRRNDPDVVAVLVGRWEVMDRFIGGRWQSVGDPEFDGSVIANLERALPLLTAKGARLALLTPPYYHRAERPDGGLWPEDQSERVDRFSTLLRDFASRHTDRVSVIHLGRLMDPQGRHRYSPYISGVFARYDGVHITPAAAALLAPDLLPQLIALDSRRHKFVRTSRP